jgi:hypothetical protein
VVAAAVAVAATAVVGRLLGAGGLEAYPRFEAATGAPEALLAALLIAFALVPFAGPSARLGVARA